MIAALNDYFVCVEYDATEGIPDDVPAMAALKRSYEAVPWTRVSFGAEWVMDPAGEFLLNSSPHFQRVACGR